MKITKRAKNERRALSQGYDLVKPTIAKVATKPKADVPDWIVAMRIPAIRRQSWTVDVENDHYLKSLKMAMRRNK